MTEGARALTAEVAAAVAGAATAQPQLRPAVTPAPPPPTLPKPRARRKTAWLALYFSTWPMTAVLSSMAPEQRAQLQGRPFAVIDQDRKRRVLACNEPARDHGLRPGHSLNAAIALCSELEVVSRDLQREAALLEATARSCQRYTSTVSLEPPDQLLLEVRGSFRLFGGVEPLVMAVHEDFTARGIPVNAALAPTARSALWLSRAGGPVHIVTPRALPAALLRLPIELLRWPPEITQRLARCGISTLADLRRLPRDGLGRRIGARYLLELDAALGRRPELRHAIRELPRYCDRVVLDAEIETTGLLEPLVAQRLLLLERFLITRTLAVNELVLELMHRVQPVTRVHIGLALPTLDMGHLQTLIRERLSALLLPEPIVELRLRAAHLVPASSGSQQLFQSRGEGGEGLPQRLARLVETLESRLGKQALRSLQAIADHRPECAQALGAPLAIPVSNRNVLPEALPQRPLWLLSEPAPVSLDDFVIVSGPERIESGWWDARPCRREYFIARGKHPRHATGGAWCWIFRDLSGPVEQWFWHGLFG